VRSSLSETGDDRTERIRQAMFGYRRNLQGEIFDPTWYAGASEKRALEECRKRMFGYYRNMQGKIVDTLEEALAMSPEKCREDSPCRRLHADLNVPCSGLCQGIASESP
jgi:hypothetical protein